MSASQSQIALLQNSEENLTLLRARSVIYDQATALLLLQIVVTVVAPVVGAVTALWVEDAKPWVAAIAIVIAALDASVIDQIYKGKLKTAALISEEFDSRVLGVPWNKFLAGPPADPEVIYRAAVQRKAGNKQLKDWYPPEVDRAPPHLASIICQRTNLWYDSSLRKLYASTLLGIIILLLIAALVVALGANFNLTEVVLTILAPSAPVLNWSTREFFRQKETANAQESVKNLADELWEDVRAKRCDEPECWRRAREFQDAIFSRRKTSALLLPWVYKIKRPEMEQDMTAGAARMLADAGF